MPGSLQSRLNPPNPPMERNISDAKVSSPAQRALDSNDKERTSFQDLLQNSNAEQARARAAQKNGDFKGSRTDEEFAKSMQDKLNRENARVPSSNLDKDAFLKLFITQMQNQDPLNPQESTEMASQLAQFHGLEQMLNVNKNLEKMASEQATNRAVSLIDFVGKDVRLSGGKLRVEKGQTTPATYSAEADIPNASLEIRDAAGVLVGKKDLGPLKRGENKLDYDGTTETGRLNDGIYTFSILGKDVQGNEVPVSITSSVKVGGIDLSDQGGSFYTELGKVRVNEVVTVGTSGFRDPTAGQVPTGGMSDPLAAMKAAATGVDPAVADIVASEAIQQAQKAVNTTSAEKLELPNAGGQATKTPLEAGVPSPPAEPQPNDISSFGRPAGGTGTLDPTTQTGNAAEAPNTATQAPSTRKPINPYNPYANPDSGNLTRPPEPFMPRRI